jgi:multicomponent K+:H+ antiporter subunit E
MMARFGLPHPLLSLLLFLMWLMLNDGVSGGQVILGLVLAILLPQLTKRFWPDSPRVKKPWRFLVYLLRVLWDIVAASTSVALIVLNPWRKPRPAFVVYPLELEHPMAITVLASTISLTPGTVSTDISNDNRLLLIHALDVDDEADLIATIRQRYEQALKEIFQ